MLHLILLLLDLFVALTAIGGGVALVAGLEADRFALELLDRTPFHSYLIPGLLLAAVVGGSAAAASVGLFLASATGAPLTAFAGVLLAGYITVELKILNDNQPWSWTELFYLVVATLMIVLGAAGWRTA